MPDGLTPQAPSPASPQPPQQAAAGLAARARLQLRVALELLQRSLPGLGVGTEEHKGALDALRALADILGRRRRRFDGERGDS